MGETLNARPLEWQELTSDNLPKLNQCSHNDMNINTAVNLDDLRKLARRKLPKIAFDFIEGGVDDEYGLERNREAFRRHVLVPRYLCDVSKRDQSVTLLGRTYSSAFGISPTGLAGLFRPDADLLLARAAAEANIPYLMSSASTNSIEDAMKVAPNNTWFQIYGTSNDVINEDLVRRARDLNVPTLVVTVDVPVNANRERNRRNGFSRPLKMTPSIVLEALGHPAWVLRYVMNGGLPMMENWKPYAPKGASAAQVAELYGSLTPAPMVTWKTLERMRTLWQGSLVVKGILHPEDAVRAADLGCDAIMVSNHGARQLDAAPSPVDMLPLIRAAVGDRMELLLDSGVRRGSDIVIALCLGARFTTFGRPTLYGAAAGGMKGIQKAIEIVRREIDMVMAQIGCAALRNLGPGYLTVGPAQVSGTPKAPMLASTGG
jgi:(S)-mandelate dehydrogenase